MKKITLSLAVIALIFSGFFAPVAVKAQTTTTVVFTPAQMAQLQQLVTLWLQLRQMSIRSLARQNPPASLIATSTIPRTNTAAIFLSLPR